MADTVYLLLGSNIGDRQRHLASAVESLGMLEGLEITAVSPVYLSAAVDMEGENPDFLNQVVKGDYLYPPSELLASIEKIERQMGRTQKRERRPRTIDIDILLFGVQVIKTDDLTVPHPELLKRPFALVPMVEIDPDLTHPVTGKLLAEYISRKDARQVMLFEDHVSRNV
jgi:2-amino-4-hydroxy-6-hydroxymethyldihydropteridine diphosphokinase